LITELRNYYCTDYSNKKTWLTENDILTDKHFITPHFLISIDIDNGISGFGLDQARLNDIINAIQSINAQCG
jgi:hypothetical protein